MSRRSRLMRFQARITSSAAPVLATGHVSVKVYLCCFHCESWKPADCPIVHDAPCPEPICGQAVA